MFKKKIAYYGKCYATYNLFLIKDFVQASANKPFFQKDSSSSYCDFSLLKINRGHLKTFITFQTVSELGLSSKLSCKKEKFINTHLPL